MMRFYERTKDHVLTVRYSSRSWVAEEGEVFRKGAVLLTPEEMETEYDSEELRKEVCNTSRRFHLTEY